MKISTLVLGNPQYTSDDRVSLTLAATFSENIVPNDVFLSIQKEGAPEAFIIAGELKDAKDAYHLDEDVMSKRHLHFFLPELDCGAHYSYQLKSHQAEAIAVLPAIGERHDRPHDLKSFKAPPAKGQGQSLHFVVSADQEALDFIRRISLDNTIAKALDLGFDHREIATQIYREIEQRKPDAFLHGGDVFHGEEIVGKTQVKSLDEFRTKIAEDHHSTARDSLGGMVSFHGKDDHDLGHNGTTAESVDKDPDAFENAFSAFKEFWPVPTVEEDQNRGLYYQVDYGDASIWYLHDRVYQEPDGTLLGAAQTEWLERTLSASKAPVKIINSPLPYVMGKNPDEDYRSRAQEWERHLKLFAENEVTAIISADSHNYSFGRITVHLEDKAVTIPHYLVGLLGGIPQKITKPETKSLPEPLFPKGITPGLVTGEVEAYYTPMAKTSNNPLRPHKEQRAYKAGKWIGKEVTKGAFGFMDVKIDFEQGKMFTSLFLTKKAQAKQKPYFTHETQCPLTPVTVMKFKS